MFALLLGITNISNAQSKYDYGVNFLLEIKEASEDIAGEIKGRFKETDVEYTTIQARYNKVRCAILNMSTVLEAKIKSGGIVKKKDIDLNLQKVCADFESLKTYFDEVKSKCPDKEECLGGLEIAGLIVTAIVTNMDNIIKGFNKIEAALIEKD